MEVNNDIRTDSKKARANQSKVFVLMRFLLRIMKAQGIRDKNSQKKEVLL